LLLSLNYLKIETYLCQSAKHFLLQGRGDEKTTGGPMKLILFLFLMSFSALAQANPPDCMKFVTSEDSAFADQYFNWLSGGEFDKAIQLLDPALKPQLLPFKEALQKSLNEVKSFEKVMIGCTANTLYNAGNNTRSINLSYQWSSPSSWYTGNLAWQEKGGSKVVYGLHITPLEAPLEKIHAFSLKGKGLLHWIFLLISIVNPILILFALILCVRTNIPKRKWLWILFIIVGIFQLNMDWTTGEISGFIYKSAGEFKINPISVQIFGAGFFRASDYAPWIVSISFPLGALVFIFKRKDVGRQCISQNNINKT
jgi:hypothetical protein